jgi:hypothetical protein
MGNKNTTQNKSDYTMPVIKRIELDNEIALQLESTPPSGPNEARQNAQEFFNQDPFKSITT